MSLELKDLRAKITPEADAVLDSVAGAFGRDKSEIVRDVLQEWATKKLHEHRLLAERLKSEGLSREGAGSGGSGSAASREWSLTDSHGRVTTFTDSKK